MPAIPIPSPTPREAIADTLHRFTTSLDLNSASLCTSSLTKNISFDSSPFKKVGMSPPITPTRAEAVVYLMSAVGTMDTTHSVTNLRIKFRHTKHGNGGGDETEREGELEAVVSCTILAQHFRHNEGIDLNRGNQGFLCGNAYEAIVAPSEDTDGFEEGEVESLGGVAWRMRSLRITPLWVTGDMEVMRR